MAEIKTQTKHKVTTAFFSGIALALVSAINKILIFLGLRPKREYWGIVYDSVTKQPLDPAILKLVYVNTNQVNQTKVTDLQGRYGFLVHPGKFKILAKKTNYIFPSQLVKGETDGVYENLYHGEFFELINDQEVLAPNIPMDPVGFDWNQKAKIKVTNSRPYLKYLLHSLVEIFFWFSFIMVTIYFVGNFKKNNLLLSGLLGAYLFLFLLQFLTPRARLWGKFLDFRAQAEGSKIILELNNANLPDVVLGKTTVDEDNKFFLRANPGTYTLSVKEIGPKNFTVSLGTIKIRIGKEGVFNRTIIVK